MPLIEQVLDKYPDSVKVVYKHYPLSFHKQALPAAIASIAAERQGKFWEYHDELFLHQSSLSPDTYMKIAENMGLDLKKFSLDLMRPSIRKQIEIDEVDAKKAGVTGTPSIFVNGRKLKTRSIDAISKLVESELVRLQK